MRLEQFIIFLRLGSKTKSFLKGVRCFGMGFGCVGVLAYFFGIVINETASWPYTVLVHLKRASPQRGDLTLFEYRTLTLLKQIVGVPGDRVHYDIAGTLWVNDQVVGLPKPTLTPLAPQIIPSTCVFVASPHENSFDSRYAEVGLIPVSKLQGRVIPVW